MRVQKGGGNMQISRCANVRMSRCADEKKKNLTSKAQVVRIRLSNSLIVFIEAYSVFHPHIRTFTHPHICKLKQVLIYLFNLPKGNHFNIEL